MKLADFQIQTTAGPSTRRGIVGEHWALTMDGRAAVASRPQCVLTDLASGLKSPAIRLTPIDAVLLIQRLDARGPASTTDAAANADVTEMLRPFFEAP